MEIFPEITAKFGKPANYADMFHADRTPNDSVRPHWVVSTTDDRERVMFARSLARSGEYRVHLALIERKIAE